MNSAQFDALKRTINAALFERNKADEFAKTRLGKMVLKVENDGSITYNWFGNSP